MLEFAKQNSVERLLYISSSEVYGKKDTSESFIEGVYGKVDIDNIRSSYPIAKGHLSYYVRLTVLNIM